MRFVIYNTKHYLARSRIGKTGTRRNIKLYKAIRNTFFIISSQFDELLSGFVKISNICNIRSICIVDVSVVL